MHARFALPVWTAPFDGFAEMARVSGGSISGMFTLPLIKLAARHGKTLPSARASYLPNDYYPVREHAQMLLETCELIYPQEPVRLALRKLGQFAPATLLTSTLGRVVLGGARTVDAAIDAMAKCYALNVRPCFVSMVEAGPSHAIVSFSDISYFVDSHHVGVFEGVLRYAGVTTGKVEIAVRDRAHADMRVSW